VYTCTVRAQAFGHKCTHIIHTHTSYTHIIHTHLVRCVHTLLATSAHTSYTHILYGACTRFWPQVHTHHTHTHIIQTHHTHILYGACTRFWPQVHTHHTLRAHAFGHMYTRFWPHVHTHHICWRKRKCAVCNVGMCNVRCEDTDKIHMRYTHAVDTDKSYEYGGQNRINTPYMAVSLVISLPQNPYIHHTHLCIYINIWFWPTLLISYECMHAVPPCPHHVAVLLILSPHNCSSV
jgi:hypothetical protein